MVLVDYALERRGLACGQGLIRQEVGRDDVYRDDVYGGGA
jgi:hypothetical protein